MQQIIHNPVDGIYAATPDYVHALEVRRPERFLYIAGTMGLRPDGSAPKTLDEQLELIWNNMRTILAEASMTTDNIVRLTSYLARSVIRRSQWRRPRARARQPPHPDDGDRRPDSGSGVARGDGSWRSRRLPWPDGLRQTITNCHASAAGPRPHLAAMSVETSSQQPPTGSGNA